MPTKIITHCSLVLQGAGVAVGGRRLFTTPLQFGATCANCVGIARPIGLRNTMCEYPDSHQFAFCISFPLMYVFLVQTKVSWLIIWHLRQRLGI